MAHNLIYLLDGSPADELALQDLRVMASDSVDVRLIADILARAHLVMRQLGLDPTDTTPMEIYNALLSAVQSQQWPALLQDTDYVLLDVDGEVISFNPIDVINNYHLQLPLEQRQTRAAKRGLGWEITRRYADDPRTRKDQIRRATQRTNWPTEEPQFCRVMFDKPSILTIGDIASEVLIELSADDAQLINEKKSPKIAINLGSKLACSQVVVQDAVGAAANAAVAMTRLGVQPSLMAWLGDDTVGQQSMQYLRRQGVDMSGVIVEKKARSNYHYVLRYGAERTILTNYQNFDYRWREPICRPDWIYLSMISNETELLHEDLLSYLKRHKNIKLAFQPGVAHFNWGLKATKEFYERASVVVMNLEEARGLLGEPKADLSTLAQKIQQLGSEIAVVTDGVNGAVAADGKRVLTAPSFPDPKKPVDRTGAGDAFAATLVSGLAKGQNLEQAMTSAAINSMGVVQQLGSQDGLLNEQQISQLLQKNKNDYSVKITKN